MLVGEKFTLVKSLPENCCFSLEIFLFRLRDKKCYVLILGHPNCNLKINIAEFSLTGTNPQEVELICKTQISKDLCC